MKWIKSFIETIVERTKRITLPGFDRIPFYDVMLFFYRGLYDGSITTRASAIAFNFFLAIFPSIIFFFTLIPYIPITDFQFELLRFLKDLMPQNAFLTIQETLEDIILNQRADLMSFSFIAALFFSTNGITSIMAAFNASIHIKKTRSWWNQRIIAIFLVIVLSLLTILAVAVLVTSRIGLEYIVDYGFLNLNLTIYILNIVKWIIMILLFFFTISFLYYYSTERKMRWRFISAGSSLTTILVFLTSYGFTYYINNFGQYNKLYGSIGTLLVILVWIYFNAIALIIGFELNASIHKLHKTKKV